MEPTRRRAPGILVVSIAAISLVAVASRAAYAQNAEAERRFVEAEALLAAGKVEAACVAFEDSNRLEPSAGTLINIGLCKEKLGRLASALEAYRAALKRVKDPKKKAIAMEREAALRPRVSRLVISVAPEAQVEGLIVSRNGERIDAAGLGRELLLDGGSYEIAAKAPGYLRWSTSIMIKAEGDKLSVKVPMLVEDKAESAREVSSAGSDEARVATAGSGKVVVNGNVKSGDVFIGADKKGRLEGGTITLTLPDGTHELAVEAPNHKRYEATITVKSGQTRTVTAELEEIVGGPPKAGGDSSRTALKVSGIGLAAVFVATGGYWLYLTVAGPERENWPMASRDSW
jgi:hypothetical protein